MRLFLPIILLHSLLLQVSCKKYVAAPEAFFIRQGTVSLRTNTSQGSGNHKISDLWIYVNGKFKGAYPVGNTIPIVSNGNKVSIDIFAGIEDNGIKDTRIYWPFYEPLHFDTLVQSGHTITRPFTFQYKSATTFAWNENFEGLGYSIVKSTTSDTGFTIASGNEGFEGRYLRLLGSNTATFAMIESTSPGFTLPHSTPNVYIEIHYKCNYTATIGLINALGIETDVFYLNPKTEWNKTYISLAEILNNTGTGKQKVFFKIAKKGSEPPELLLDNVKLVYI